MSCDIEFFRFKDGPEESYNFTVRLPEELDGGETLCYCFDEEDGVTLDKAKEIISSCFVGEIKEVAALKQGRRLEPGCRLE